MQRPLIMIVEDEPLVALTISALVEDLGLRVAGPFRTNEEVALFLQSNRPAAAILDYHLRAASVARTASSLKQMNVPFAVVSGYDSDPTCDAAFDGIDWLEKPFNEGALSDAILRCLKVTNS